MRHACCSLGPFTSIPAWRPRLKDEDVVRGKFVLEETAVQHLLEDNAMGINELLQALVAPAAEMALPFLSGFYVGYFL